MIEIFTSSYSGITLVAIMSAYILALMFSFGFHEWAHAFAATKQGDMTAKALGRLSINPLVHLDPMGTICLLFFGFGWAKPVPINPLKFKNYKKGSFIVSIAGVLANLIMCIIFSFAYVLFIKYVTAQTTILIFVENLLLYLTIIPFILAVFNIMPIHPLDGFKAIRSFAKYDNKFFNFMERYGTIILIIFMFSSLFSIVYNLAIAYILQPLINLWVLII